MAEHCHFISCFSVRICDCMLVGHIGPRSPPVPTRPTAPWDTPGPVFIYISPFQIPLKSQWQLSDAMFLCILGTLEGSFNDGSIPYSQRLSTVLVSCVFLSSFFIFYVQCIPICYT